ncbi:MAG: hypothetical protein FWD56_01760 [Bacteroidales bacterium]|nr:hypothetical protein [Bacteroidales bacterium]
MINAIIATIALSLALVALYILLEPKEKPRRLKFKKKRTKKIPEVVLAKADVTPGVYAAIAAAIHLYGEELHDVENAVLTINKVSRSYSPWSSKIHGLNTYFRR